MARKKIKLAYIKNDSQRKVTFRKRRNDLMKKVSDLSTLCDIDACAIVYSPYETQPDVWPNTSEVHRIVSQFKRMPQEEQCKKMVNQEDFIRQRIAKATEQLKKKQYDNREKYMTDLMYQCLIGKGLQNLVMEDLIDLEWLVDKKLNEINKRIESLKKGGAEQQIVVQQSSAPIITEMTSTSVNEQLQKLAMDFGVEYMQNPNNWMNESNKQINFGRGDEVMIPFNNHQSNAWPGFFFP